MAIKIFLSSTFIDLEEIRKTLIDELSKYKSFLEVVAMEKNKFWESSPPQKTSIGYLKDSDIYLLLIGNRYGELIGGCKIYYCPLRNKECNGNISYTHCEYRFAKGKGIPRLCLRLYCGNVDKDLEEFIKEVKEEETPRYIQVNGDITKVAERAVKEVKSRLPEKIVDWYNEGKVQIPEFFGRRKKLFEIWKNFKEGEVIFISGIGGVGKTCLAEVLLTLKVMEGWKVLAIYRGVNYLSGTGYKPFKQIADRLGMVDVVKCEKLTYSELCRIIASVRGKIDCDSLAEIIDHKNIILFLDDLQFANKEVQKFVEYCAKNLTGSVIVVTSRRREDFGRVIFIEGLKDDFDKFVMYLAGKYSVKINENEIEEIKEISRGHPLLTEIIVKNWRRYKISNLSGISKLGDEEYVEEFLKRFIKENIRGNKLKVLKMLSVFRTEVEKEIADIFKVNENVFVDLIDWLMLINRDGSYTFYDDLVKESVQSLLKEERKEAHKIAVSYYKKFYNEYCKGDKSKISDIFEYLYHLVECGKFKEAWKVINDKGLFKELRDNANLEEFAEILKKIYEKLSGCERSKIALKIAYVYNDLGRFNKTLETLKKNLKYLENSEKIEAYRELSLAYIRIGNPLYALKTILEAITFAKDDNFKRCLRGYGVINWYLSNFKVAESYYNKSFVGAFKLGAISYDIGDARIRLGRLSNAYESFEEGRKHAESSKDKCILAENSLGIGNVLTLLGKHDEATKMLDEAKNNFLKLRYIFIPCSYVCLGILYHIKGQFDEAKKYYEKARERSGNHDYIKAVALHNLGIVYTDLGNLNEAEDKLNRTKEIFEKYWSSYGKARVLHHLGIIEELRGNFEGAREYYNKSLELKEDLTGENKEKIYKAIKNDPEFKELVE
ncbi:MAG TPA: tetratricopeptide repeat protein, partial [Thermoplasmatales archaeon]|nr:tetratricopeptide repeat protein [Thermoplasmatales archaeon]